MQTIIEYGLANAVAATVLAVRFGLPFGWVIVFGLLTGVALVDLVVVAWRKRSENG